MIKCYHVRRVQLVIDKETQLFYDGPIIAPLIATIDSNIEELEDIWDCCNNSCWYDRGNYMSMTNYRDKFSVKFTNDYSGYCNDDLIVEMNGLYHVAKRCGWHKASSLDDAIKYCERHSNWCELHDKGHQFPTGREHTIDELNIIKLQYENQGFKCYLHRD